MTMIANYDLNRLHQDRRETNDERQKIEGFRLAALLLRKNLPTGSGRREVFTAIITRCEEDARTLQAVLDERWGNHEALGDRSKNTYQE
jgi:hypothetical protein